MALLTIVCALATLYTTGMIYASLPTIRQWHQPLTAPIYVVLGLASGAVLLDLLLALFGVERRAATWVAVIAIVIAAALKWLYWLRIDGEARTYTAEAATGLGHLGKVRPLEPPHTQPNFVMREMGYRVARKHAERLRGLALLLAFAAPRRPPAPVAPAGRRRARHAARRGVDGGRPHDRALAVLRRGRARRHALLWRRGGVALPSPRLAGRGLG